MQRSCERVGVKIQNAQQGTTAAAEAGNAPPETVVVENKDTQARAKLAHDRTRDLTREDKGFLRELS
jgi:hypothetical protein